MGHAFSNLLNHIVFSTKGRKNLLYKDIRDSLYAYICGIAKAESCQIIKIGGIENHIHILVKLKPSLATSDFTRKIKANSSKWIHEQYPNLKVFSWQSGFSCFSVSESVKNSLISYIGTQEEHHKRIPFQDELKIFLEKHRIDFDKEHFLD
jgi:putative transposase